MYHVPCTMYHVPCTMYHILYTILCTMYYVLYTDFVKRLAAKRATSKERDYVCYVM